jgi:RalA-binding protein 1
VPDCYVGSSSEVTKLRQIFATGQCPVDLTGSDANAVASLLKMYFRELPDQIFTQQFFVDLGSIYTITDTQQRLVRLRQITADTLPPVNFGVASHLFLLLHKIAQNKNVNRMSPNNLAIVFSPTLKITPELCQYLVENAPDIFSSI